MSVVLVPFMYLAAWGFLLSLAAHCLSLANVPIPGGNLVFGLHVGVFVVFFPALFASRGITRNVNRRDYWRVILAGCPAWMRWGVYTVFAYAVVNFIYFMAFLSPWIKKTGNMNGGVPPPAVIRAFSGHWMAFYFASFAMLYSRIHAPQLYCIRKCAEGHSVPPLAKYCPECGAEMSDA
jgi:H+/Cl- antiporter ClcA